jgi:hypothetical protein
MRRGEFPGRGAALIALSSARAAVSISPNMRIPEVEKQHGNLQYQFLKAWNANGIKSMLKPGSPLLEDEAALKALDSHVRTAYAKGELFSYETRMKLGKLTKDAQARYAKHIIKGPFGGRYMDMLIVGMPETQFVVGKDKKKP